MTNDLISENIHIAPDEHIALITRRHWLMLLRNIIAILFVGILVLALFIFILGGSGKVSPFLVLAIMTTLLVIWLALFTAWTNHYLDIWIVTDKRIIDIDQISLFKRTRSTLRIERVQNVSVHFDGILEEIFDLGTIRVETAGYKTDLSIMEGIPHPNDVSRLIMQYVDMVTENKNKLDFDLQNKPTHSE